MNTVLLAWLIAEPTFFSTVDTDGSPLTGCLQIVHHSGTSMAELEINNYM